ncbi:Na+/proline symporter [Arthrobacter bambusae]|uniref:Na+/proline symporter n=1 Tax=Arthrobacter bambusae TaxID=1338426 RepID=A0AAW8DHC6_9MICC|nr:Na+/proline symporter [Arthrobacter bambusae]MDQ0131147.1 Na+/proline symporter [Arthrobacter bambusae]MDQ0181861.1 Na+/proline symporter [Arthrobacter bambusae]
MVLNPTAKPKVATAGLVSTSTVVLIALVVFLVSFPAAELPALFKVIVAGLLVAAALLSGGLWWKRVNHLRTWLAEAREQWRSFDNARLASGTTTEITLLSVDAIQPTGSWVTIEWNRFNHVQPAWIEAQSEPIWPGSVLLITPDPAQVRPSAPWPEAYFIRAADCLAWAPSEGRPIASLLTSPIQQGEGSIQHRQG